LRKAIFIEYSVRRPGFRSLREFSDRYSSRMQQLTKDMLTTKITKGSDSFTLNFVLFVPFMVKSVFAFLVAARPHQALRGDCLRTPTPL
jgi:hypothetical protein